MSTPTTWPDLTPPNFTSSHLIWLEREIACPELFRSVCRSESKLKVLIIQSIGWVRSEVWGLHFTRVADWVAWHALLNRETRGMQISRHAVFNLHFVSLVAVASAQLFSSASIFDYREQHRAVRSLFFADVVLIQWLCRCLPLSLYAHVCNWSVSFGRQAFAGRLRFIFTLQWLTTLCASLVFETLSHFAATHNTWL